MVLQPYRRCNIANTKVTDLTELNATPATGDLIHIVDVSDTTDDAAGSSKKITWVNLVKNYVDGLISTLSSSLTTHTSATDTHGATGAVVGTTNTQTLTNKTLTSPILNTGVSGTAIIDDDTMATASDTTIPTSESVKEYVDANAGAGGKFMFVIPGTAAAGTDVAGTWFAPGSITITAIDLHADTAGATGSTVIDVNKNGTSIYPSASKPTLADTATSDTGNVPDTTTGVANDKYTIDIDSITTTAPTDLYVVIKYTE